MKKISNLLIMALLTMGMGLTSCDEMLDNAVTPYTPGVTPESEVAASSIALDQTMKVIKLGGDALTITATVTPTDATDKTVTWESKDPTIATVENGVVTPVGVGITTITAKSGELSATCEVFVGNEVNISSITYEAKNYDILKGDMGAKQLTIPNDIKVVFNGVQTTEQIICLGDATIYLADGSENTVTVLTNEKAGMKIGGTGTTLTINGETAGTGQLNAKGGDQGAGIGTNKNETGGNIVINGGTVTAICLNYAAGIGTGYANGSTNTCGTITINGGTVTAKGGNGAAGIGTGDADGSTNTCNTCSAITINGGTVNAIGGGSAAGIGTGYANQSTSTNECGDITIGTGVISVTAKKGYPEPGPNSIGIGKITNSGTQKCGTITFGTKEVYDGGDWTTYNSMTAGTYGGLKLVISKKDVDDDIWTLTPEE